MVVQPSPCCLIPDPCGHPKKETDPASLLPLLPGLWQPPTCFLIFPVRAVLWHVGLLCLAPPSARVAHVSAAFLFMWVTGAAGPLGCFRLSAHHHSCCFCVDLFAFFLGLHLGMLGLKVTPFSTVENCPILYSHPCQPGRPVWVSPHPC